MGQFPSLQGQGDVTRVMALSSGGDIARPDCPVPGGGREIAAYLWLMGSQKSGMNDLMGSPDVS